ncbi:hypothetical protein MASR2M15_01920 [Anaerolineales bacterium]
MFVNLQLRAVEIFAQMNESTRGLFIYLWRAIRNFMGYGTQRSATLAYYSIFSIFPFILLLAVGITTFLGPTVAQEQIINGIKLFFPAETASFIEDNVVTLVDQAASFGLIAALSLVWSALGLFSNITRSLDQIFDVPIRRGMWRQRLVAFLMSITLILIIMASFLTSGALRFVAVLFFDQPSLWVSIGIQFLPLGLDVVIFALVLHYIPARYVHWDAVWPAALLGAIGWEIADSVFGWYLANLADYQVVYGSLATGIVLLFWAYILAMIFLFSAEICARLNEWLSLQRQVRDVSPITKPTYYLKDSEIEVGSSSHEPPPYN